MVHSPPSMLARKLVGITKFRRFVATDTVNALRSAQNVLTISNILLQSKNSPKLNLRNHNIALKRMCEIRGYSPMLSLFKQMQISRNPLPDVNSFAIVIHCCNKRGDYNMALEVWYQLLGSGNRPNSFCLNQALLALANMLRWELALKTLNDIPQQFDFVASDHCFVTVISTCSKSGRPKEAIDLLNILDKREGNVSPHAYSAAMSSCTTHNPDYGYLKALDLYKAYQEKLGEPNSVLLGSLINVCAVHGHWHEALKLLKRNEANIVSYNSALHACANVGEWECCLNLLGRMRSDDSTPKPNVVSYTTVIGALAPSGKWQKALTILKTMKDDNIKPNLFTYSAAISVCLKAGHWKKALEVLEYVPKDERRLNEILSSLEMRAWALSGTPGCYEKVLHVFTEMTKVDCFESDSAEWIGTQQLTNIGDLHVYQLALEACSKLGKPKAAFNIIDSMLCNGPQPDARCFNASIIAFSQHVSNHEDGAKRISDILPVLEEMKLHDIMPNADTIVSMINALGLMKAPTQALSLLAEYFDPVGGGNKFKPSAVAYTATMLALSRGSEQSSSETAINLLVEPVRLGIFLDSRFFKTALFALAKFGLHVEVLALFRAVSESTSDEGFKSMCDLTETRYIQFADISFQAELLETLTSNPHVAKDLLNDIEFWNCALNASAQMNDGELALFLISSMRERQVLPDAISLWFCTLACCSTARHQISAERRGSILHSALGLIEAHFHFDLSAIAAELGACFLALDRAGVMKHEELDGLRTRLRRVMRRA